MDSLERDLREMFLRREADLPTVPPGLPRPLLHRTRRRQVATIAGSALSIVAVLVVSIVAIRAVRQSEGVTPAARPNVTTEGPVPRGKLIASGDGWDLRLSDDEVGGANWRILCFKLVGPNLHDVSCNYVNPQYIGVATVYSLERERALFYGTVSTHVAKIHVGFEDGSSEEAGAFAPPETIEIEDNLFVLELQGPEGRATVTLLDKRGRVLNTGELRLPPRQGEIFFAFDP
jgi:hypothetical protein